jgi:beta-xylosidase
VLAQGSTPVNGPHQGALVDTPAGASWFLHFQDKGAYGRIVHLEPVTWRNDWPVIGLDPDGDGCGEPALTHAKPVLPIQPVTAPPTGDDFENPPLGVQWQWQANPRADWASLTAQPGALRLFAPPAAEPNLWSAPHLLLQKFPAPGFTATTRVTVAPGARAGLIIFGADYSWVGIESGHVTVHRCLKADTGAPAFEVATESVGGRTVELRVTVGPDARCRFSWSADGGTFAAIGEPFEAKPGRWVGAKVGMFCERAPGSEAAAAPAHADFAWFKVTR